MKRGMGMDEHVGWQQHWAWPCQDSTCPLAGAGDQRPVFEAAQPPRASSRAGHQDQHNTPWLGPTPAAHSYRPQSPCVGLPVPCALPETPSFPCPGAQQQASHPGAHGPLPLRDRRPTDPCHPGDPALNPSLLRAPGRTDSSAPRASSPAAPACPRLPAPDPFCPRPQPTPGAPPARGTDPCPPASLCPTAPLPPAAPPPHSRHSGSSGSRRQGGQSGGAARRRLPPNKGARGRPAPLPPAGAHRPPRSASPPHRPRQPRSAPSTAVPRGESRGPGPPRSGTS